MRIGIDARLYSQTGVGRYIRNLIRELAIINKNDEFYIYLNNPEYSDFHEPSSKWHKVLLNLKWHSLQEQIVMPIRFLLDRLDVAHFPYFNVPIFYPGKYLLTIHDLIVDHFDTGRASTLPFVLYKLKRLAYHFITKVGVRRATTLAVISQSTKREVIDHYGKNVPIVLTYDAIDSHFSELVDTHSPKKYYDFDYILYIGNAYPHKNLERLVDAFALIKKKQKIKLLLAGNDEFFFPRLKKYVVRRGLQDDVIFFGNANDEQLIDLLNFAKCLVFPSLMEGFGLPNLEAVLCGCIPVIADISVFKEIWENILPMYNPYNITQMADQIYKTLRMDVKAKTLILAKANRVVSRFSWKETALLTSNLYKSIAK